MTGHPFIRGVFGVVVLLGLVLGGAHVMYAGKAYPGVHVGGLSVGGLSRADVAAAVSKQAAVVTEFRYHYRDRTITFPAADIGLTFDPDATTREVLQAGREGGLASAFGPYRTATGSRDVSPVYHFNQVALREKLLGETRDIGTPLHNATVVRDGDAFAVSPEQNGSGADPDANILAARAALDRFGADAALYVRPYRPDIRARDLGTVRSYASALADKPLEVTVGDRSFRAGPDRLIDWVSFARHRVTTETGIGPSNLMDVYDQLTGIGQEDQAIIPNRDAVLRAEPNPERVGQFVAEVGEAVDSPPVNARVGFTNGQLVITGQPKDGQVIDRPTAVSRVSEAMQTPDRRTALALSAKPADIRAETLPKLKITSLIGSATTTFSGSPTNRIFNIGVGADKFDGVLIKPGEEFSFDQTLGDVGPETGYRPELVILANKTAPQYGGGLCQVSTTMFRAALAAGLPITARTNHSYAVHYYDPIGMDATIYPPSPDMKFKNNTPGYILVQTHHAGVSLTYDFYGTSDGRTAHTQILTQNATEAAGGTASFRYVVEGGAEPINRVFFSSYQPHSAFPVSSSFN